ncbi:MAG: hypothetical protein HC917_16980 [Richelia sp. SM2_1_7]|nr:hypothetical protein [Richelia sp. SM2_1_7]
MDLFLRQLQTATTQQIVENHPVFNYQNLGLTLIIVGILILALATLHYNRVFWQIEQANFRPNRLLIFFLSIIVILLGILSIPLVLTVKTQLPQLETPINHNQEINFLCVPLRYTLRHSALKNLNPPSSLARITDFALYSK